MGRRDLIIVVRGVIVLESCPADGAAMGSAFANPVSRHTCVIVFFYHIPQSCESRIELKLSLGAWRNQGWDSSFRAGLRRKISSGRMAVYCTSGQHQDSLIRTGSGLDRQNKCHCGQWLSRNDELAGSVPFKSASLQRLVSHCWRVMETKHI